MNSIVGPDGGQPSAPDPRPAADVPGSGRTIRILSTIGIGAFAVAEIEAGALSFVWSLTALLDLPQAAMWGGMALASLAGLWLVLWLVGRNWHVEGLLEQGLDIDEPVWTLGAYWRRKTPAA